MILSYSNYLLEKELEELDNLPTTLKGLFEFIETGISNELYKNDEFTKEDLLILEEFNFNGLDKEFLNILSQEDDTINESLKLFEKIGGNRTAKFIRIKTKKLLIALKDKYLKLIEKAKNIFNKKAQLEKDPVKRKGILTKLADKLKSLKDWFTGMSDKLKTKSDKIKPQLALA